LLFVTANIINFAVIRPISNGCANVMDWSIQFRILMLIPLGIALYIVYIISKIISYS